MTVPATTNPGGSTREQRKVRAQQEAQAAAVAARRRRLITRAVVFVAVLAVLGVLFSIYRSTESSPSAQGGAGKYVYKVGKPGPGQPAPDFSLPSNKGGNLGPSKFAGKTVLTYWHEGLGCQPCWDQIKTLEDHRSELKTAGIDDLVSITSGPLDSLNQKMVDDKLDSTLLADTDLAVSRKYQMNKFGMMGDSRDGHTFLLIGPDGKILWRADYGGEPNYTMFVPVNRLLDQLKAGTR